MRATESARHAGALCGSCSTAGQPPRGRGATCYRRRTTAGASSRRSGRRRQTVLTRAGSWVWAPRQPLQRLARTLRTQAQPRALDPSATKAQALTDSGLLPVQVRRIAVVEPSGGHGLGPLRLLEHAAQRVAADVQLLQVVQARAPPVGRELWCCGRRHGCSGAVAASRASATHRLSRVAEVWCCRGSSVVSLSTSHMSPLTDRLFMCLFLTLLTAHSQVTACDVCLAASAHIFQTFLGKTTRRPYIFILLLLVCAARTSAASRQSPSSQLLKAGRCRLRLRRHRHVPCGSARRH